MWNQQPYYGNQHSAPYAPRYNPYMPRHTLVNEGASWVRTYPMVPRVSLVPLTNVQMSQLEPPPPPPPETPPSSGGQPTTMKQERSTRAKNWVRTYAEVPQAPPEPSVNMQTSPLGRQPQPRPLVATSTTDVMNQERKPSPTSSDLPSPPVSADFFDRDPRTRKRRDSDSLPVPASAPPSVEATRYPKNVTPENAGLNKTCEPAEKKGRKTLEAEDKQKRSNIGELVGSHFDNMKAHYKKEVKKLAERCNELKKINGRLLQEKDELQQQYEFSVQKMKRDIDNTERSIKEGLQDKITRLENALRVSQEELKRRQEAEVVFQTEQASRMRKCEEEKESLRRKNREHVEFYLSKVDKLNKAKDDICADNIVQKTNVEQLTAQLEDSKRKIVELRGALTVRDTTVESQQKTIDQLQRATQAQKQQVREELLKFIERMEQTL